MREQPLKGISRGSVRTYLRNKTSNLVSSCREVEHFELHDVWFKELAWKLPYALLLQCHNILCNLILLHSNSQVAQILTTDLVPIAMSKVVNLMIKRNSLSRYSRANMLVDIPLDLDRVALIKQRFLTLASCMPMDKFLSGWFRGVAPDKVLRGNVEDFIAYGFYCRRLEELTPEVPVLQSIHQ